MGFFAALGVFSSLSLNLALQFGLGMRGLSAGRRKNHPVPFLEAGVIFLSVLILWLFFTFILAPLQLGFFWYILLFPLSALVCTLVEWLLAQLVRFLAAKVIYQDPPPKGEKRSRRLFRGISAYDGLVPLSLLLTLNVGFTILEAAVLSFGFALGILLTSLILKEINRRAGMEAVPRFLRGDPLTLISMGLLSLIFSFAGIMFFDVLVF
jgi:electron transport complex protein RnfA